MGGQGREEIASVRDGGWWSPQVYWKPASCNADTLGAMMPRVWSVFGKSLFEICPCKLFGGRQAYVVANCGVS